MELHIASGFSLELLHPGHAREIYQLAIADRAHLREWLTWVDMMQDETFISRFIEGSMERNRMGAEYAFAIRYLGNTVGRIGVFKIDLQHHSGEIGYWLGSGAVGKGIASSACQALIGFSFEQLGLNRLEIRCGTGNIRSQTIPERLGFRKEGTLRQAERIRGDYQDLYLYALLKDEWKPPVG